MSATPKAAISRGPQGAGRAGVQDPPHPDCAGQKQCAGEHEVGDLDPSHVADAQQAERVAGRVEALPGRHLSPDDHGEQRACDAAAE